MTSPSDNSVDILQGRDGRLPRYSYKLAEDVGRFGLDVPFGELLDCDVKRMSIVIPFADGNRRDGVGDLLEVGGIRTERHQKNPIVLFDHGKQVTLPVALAQDPETKQYTVDLDPVSRVARANAFFYQGGKDLEGLADQDASGHALFCEQLFDLMVKGYVRAGSIGYQVVHARELPPDYETGTPKGLHLLSVLMLELSAVVLPANGDTVRKALALPHCCGKPLSPLLIKGLEPYAQGDRVVVSVNIPNSATYAKSVGDEEEDDYFDPKVGDRVRTPWGPGTVIRVRIGPTLKNHVRLDDGRIVDLRTSRLDRLKSLPSDEIDPDKACQILKDGQANGQPLTEDQRQMFGAACSRKKTLGEIRRKYRQKFINVETFKDRTQARQFADDLTRRNCRVTRFTQDSAGQWLVYWDTNCSVGSAEQAEEQYVNTSGQSRDVTAYRNSRRKAIGEVRNKYRKKAIATGKVSSEEIRRVLASISIAPRSIIDVGHALKVTVDKHQLEEAWDALQLNFDSVTADYNFVYVYHPMKSLNGNNTKARRRKVGEGNPLVGYMQDVSGLGWLIRYTITYHDTVSPRFQNGRSEERADSFNADQEAVARREAADLIAHPKYPVASGGYFVVSNVRVEQRKYLSDAKARISGTPKTPRFDYQINIGDTVTARSYIFLGSGTQGLDDFAAPGDRLKVESVEEDGFVFLVRNQAGLARKVRLTEIRKGLSHYDQKAGETATYYSDSGHGNKKIVVENGVVTYSDVPEISPVGQKPNKDFIRKAVWKKKPEVKPQAGPRGELPGQSFRKNIGDIRRKYRKMTAVRHRVKRSSPGTSVMLASSKDVETIRQAAEQKGIKFERVGFKGELEKIRLTGDDSAIDGIAKQYGTRA